MFINIKPVNYFVLLLLITACSSKPYVIKQTDIVVPASNEIYVVGHDWHTGFVIPAEAIQAQIPQLEERFGDTPYLEFGWGDEGFYQAEEITSGLSMQAIFWPTESVMHVVAVPLSPDAYFPESKVEILHLDKNQYAMLISFIEQSFYKDANGSVIKLKNGIYGNSQFYKAEGDFYWMNTCNKWTAKGLESAGLDISSTFKLTSDSVMDYLSSRRSD
ncbi:TIGR02117 family protein [Pseudomonadota bacterium]